MSSHEAHVFPFDVMSLIEWKGHQSTYFRFVHFDRDAKMIYVLPMGRKPRKPKDCKITTWLYDEVALLLGTEICQVDDFVKPYFMADDVALTKSERMGLAENQKILLPVIDGEICRELELSRHAIEIYTDETLREAVFAEAAKRCGKRKDFVRNLFYQRLWFGACDRSVVPLFRLRGGAGESRVSTNKKKAGRPREVVRGGRLRKVSDIGRVTPQWLEIFRHALEDFYRGRNKTSVSFVYDRMVERLKKEWAKTGNSKKVKAKARLIPLKSAFNYHANRLIVEMGLDKKYPPPQIDDTGARGGHSVDVTFGRQVGDIDCTKMNLVEIVCRDPEGKFVSAGSPILAFLVDRDSGCIVSWVVWYGRAENKTIYRHLVLKAFLSKKEWLDRIGYKGDRSGFVTGKIDAVCPDRGPGYSKDIRTMLSEEMKLGIAAPPPRTPEGKPHVEGRFGNLKVMLRWVLKQLSKMEGGIIFLTKPKGNGRKREPGVVARLTRTAFELLIAKAVYIINTRKYRQCHVFRGVIPSRYKGLTPATVFQKKQDERRGDATVPVSSENVYKRFLEGKDGFVRAGKVKLRNHTYSSASLRAYEKAYRGKNGIKLKKGVPISYYILPGRDSLLWFKTDGQPDVLEPTAKSEMGDEVDLLDEVDVLFTNRVNAAVSGSGRQREPTQRSRYKKEAQDVFEEQLAAIGKLPEKIPRDAAARAALQQQVETEEFYSAINGAGLSVPSRSTEVADDCAYVEGDLVEPARLEQQARGSKKGGWFRTQRERGNH